MDRDKAAEILQAIGNLLVQSSPGEELATLLWFEVREGVSDESIFDEFDDHIMWRDTEYYMGDERWPLSDLVRDLWKLEPPERRWAEIEYIIRDGRFTARFVYEEDIERELDADGLPTFDGEVARRDAVIARHLSEKPIRYPPLLDSDEAGQTFVLGEPHENGEA